MQDKEGLPGGLAYSPDEGDPGAGTPGSARTDAAGSTVVTGPMRPVVGGMAVTPGVRRDNHVPAYSARRGGRPMADASFVEHREVTTGGRPGAARKNFVYNPRGGAVPVTVAKPPGPGQAAVVGVNMGGSIDIAPWHSMLSKLSVTGAGDYAYFAAFIHSHARLGSVAPGNVMRKLHSLAQYGDQNAATLYNYAGQVAQQIAAQNRNRGHA